MGTTMTFEMVRWGWPNVIAILTLAVMPIVSLGTTDGRRAPPSQIESVDDEAPSFMVGNPAIAAE